VLQYGATCLPGTATAAGCADDQTFYAVQVPWERVIGPEGWTAPGGNRYWASTTPATSYNPVAKAILRLMADVSRKHFKYTFSKDEYRGLTMATVLNRYQGKLATQYGIVKIEIQPNPHETAGAFAARGGYLLWIDPETGPFRSKIGLDSYRPLWLAGTDITGTALWADYDAARGSLGYSVRVVYKGLWQKTMDATLGQIGKATVKFCEGVTSDKAAAAGVAIALYPGAQAYAVAWGTAAAMCSINKVPCAPRPDQPLPATPTIAAGSWKGAMTASGASSAATIPSGLLSPALSTGAPGVPTLRYPEGTIAWFDAAAGAYRIASPQPGADTTHVVRELQSTVPGGVTIVDKAAWERATLPFWRRSSTKIGMMIGGIAAASLATVYVGRVNR
jgi:hypothetical protein